MKKVIFHLDSSADPERAGQALGELSGVLSTDVQEDRLIVHCGRRMGDEMLLNALRDHGCRAQIVPPSFS